MKIEGLRHAHSYGELVGIQGTIDSIDVDTADDGRLGCLTFRTSEGGKTELYPSAETLRELAARLIAVADFIEAR